MELIGWGICIALFVCLWIFLFWLRGKRTDDEKNEQDIGF